MLEDQQEQDVQNEGGMSDPIKDDDPLDEIDDIDELEKLEKKYGQPFELLCTTALER
jgi:hypothetical protein